MEASERQDAVEAAARQAATVRRLRSEAGSAVSLVREAARIIRWFGFPQPADALGSQYGIVHDEAFELVSDTYRLIALPHTATGRPALVIETIGAALSGEPPPEDQRLFRHILDRVSRARVMADWDAPQRYCVALDVPVHPSLVKAVTSNRTRFARCDDLAHHTDEFVLPSGWHG